MECSSFEEKTFDVSEFSAAFGQVRPFARMRVPKHLCSKEANPTWVFVGKLWPQTINGYAFEQVTHLLTFQWLFPVQHLIAQEDRNCTRLL
jgi:hypothetical protein